jgi:hypothetical protein
MTLQDFASIGELLGAVGVIISLIYLAAQVQQNTAALRASSITGVTDRTADSMGMVATDQELAKLLGKGVAGDSPLDPDERIRFELLMGSWFTHWQGMHRQISVGAIDEELFNAWLPVISFYARNPQVGEWLASSRSALTPEFRAFLTDLATPHGRHSRLGPPSHATVRSNVSRFYCVAWLLTSEAYPHDNPRL